MWQGERQSQTTPQTYRARLPVVLERDDGVAARLAAGVDDDHVGDDGEAVLVVPTHSRELDAELPVAAPPQDALLQNTRDGAAVDVRGVAEREVQGAVRRLRDVLPETNVHGDSVDVTPRRRSFFGPAGEILRIQYLRCVESVPQSGTSLGNYRD